MVLTDMSDNKLVRFLVANVPRLTRLVPDTQWCNHVLSQIFFYTSHKRFASPNQPKDINDHIFRFKTSRQAANYGYFVDKILVKRLITAMGFEHYLIQPLAVIDTPDALEAFTAPVPYIVKPSHMSGQSLIKQGGKLTPEELKRCSYWLKADFYRHTRENNYRYLEPRVLIEPILYFEDQLPRNYHFYTVNGKCHLLKVNTDRHSGNYLNLYDAEFNRVEGQLDGVPNFPEPVSPSVHFEEMLAFAERLGSLFEFARIDLFDTNEGIKFGEITLTPGNAANMFEPAELGKALGERMEALVPA